MPIRRLVRPLALAAALALPAARLAAQDHAQHPDTAFRPRNAKEAASNTANESKRVYKRGEKTVRKAGKDTQKQLKRTGRHLARTVSPAERERQEAEKRAKAGNP
jgi:hypothetical protein